MFNNTSKTLRVSAAVFATLVTLLFLRAIFSGSSDNHRPNKFRVEEPVVLILVHPSPSLNKIANFELKRAIARTWAKDVEDLGASVFFVGEHDGETVMRRPSEFQGRAQSLSSRFGPGSLLAKETINAVGGGQGQGESEYSKEEPMRKMLIPSAYHFLYNNTNWYAGPIFQTYPFVLTTDTTHYIHVENLVTTLLSSRPRRLLTMRDDSSFSGSISEASECSAEDFGDKTPQQGGDDKASPSYHWTLSRTHLISKQVVAMVGPHLRYCVDDAPSVSKDAGVAFQSCVKNWTSNPLFWKNGYCGRLAALRYQAPSPGSYLDTKEPVSFNRKIQRRSPTGPEEFTEFYDMKQRERALELQRQMKDGPEAAAVVNDGVLMKRGEVVDREKSKKILQQLTSSSPESPARWVVASGLTQTEDFALIYQGLSDNEEKEENLEEDDY
ncbi:hypothetical protein BGX27_003445 [Mortierella sp. AM989]|nr:hypothetical protein BGX27_003445 [Mortierella sp. AM989]